jgi:hypothetical protein
MRIIFPIIIFILAACSQPASLQPVQLNFSGSAYRLNVAEIAIAEEYVSSHHLPHVEYASEVLPADTIKKWIESRLNTAGSANQLEVVIKDASIIKKDVPKAKSGLEGFFTKEQTEEYEGRMEVSLKIYSEKSTLPVAHTEAIVHQLLSLREDATAFDRKNLYNQMTTDLIQALDRELSNNIQRYFSNYLL